MAGLRGSVRRAGASGHGSLNVEFSSSPSADASERLVYSTAMTTADVRVRVGVGAGPALGPQCSPPAMHAPLAAPLGAALGPALDLNDRTLFAVYCFIKNFIG